MRPVIPKNKLSYKLWIIYAAIFIICVAGIAIALSKTEYFENENIGRAIGIIDKEAKKEDEYNELKTEFDTIFTNQVENLGQDSSAIKKINSDYDIVVTAYNYKEEKADQIRHSKYSSAIELAPLFLKHDQLKLREFVKQFIKKPDKGEILYTIENGKIKPSVALQDAIGTLLKGNKVFTMIDEQQVAYATIKKLVESTIDTDEKHTEF